MKELIFKEIVQYFMKKFRQLDGEIVLLQIAINSNELTEQEIFQKIAAIESESVAYDELLDKVKKILEDETI